MKHLLKVIFTNRGIVCILVCVLFLFFVMNGIIPHFSDDLIFQYRHEQFGERYSSVCQVIEDAVGSWTYFNGRIICTFFMRFYSGYLGENAFNIVNTCMFALMILLMALYVLPQKAQSNMMGWTLIFIVLFYLSTGEDYLYYWGAGAGTYMISVILTLACLLIFKKLQNAENLRFGHSLCLGIIGFIMAFQHEVFAFTLSASFLFYLLLHREYINRAILVFCVCFLIGSLTNVLSPGILHRGALSSGYETMALTKQFIIRCLYVLPSLRLFYVLVISFFAMKMLGRITWKDFLGEYQLLFLCICFSIVPPLYASQGGRAVYATEFFSGLLLVNLFVTRLPIRRLPSFFLFLFSYAYFCLVAVYVNRQWNTIRHVADSYYQSPGQLQLYVENEIPVWFSRFVGNLQDFYKWDYVISGYQIVKEYDYGHKNAEAMIPVPKNLYDLIISGKHNNEVIYNAENKGFLLCSNSSSLTVTIKSHITYIPLIRREKVHTKEEMSGYKVSIPQHNSNCFFVPI